MSTSIYIYLYSAFNLKLNNHLNQENKGNIDITFSNLGNKYIFLKNIANTEIK